MGKPFSATPQPFRPPSASTVGESRNSYESELWDEMANVIFSDVTEGPDTVLAGASDTIFTITIPCPVKTRLEIHAQTVPDASGMALVVSLGILLDGVLSITTGDAAFPAGSVIPLTLMGTLDVNPGPHILAVEAVADPGNDTDFYRTRIIVRRGRSI